MNTDSIEPRFLQESRRVYRPGMPALPPGLGRYEVAGATALSLRLAAGDILRVVDSEGGQAAEVLAFDLQGKCDAGLLGAKANGKASGLKAMFARGAEPRFYALLSKTNIVLADAVSINCFGNENKVGAEVSFVAAAECLVIVAAPGEDMAVDAHNSPTPLIVFVESAPTATKESSLPEPLAEPLADFRISRTTAAAYTVAAGDWIQIIDVEGRQCTDFQAFSTAALDKGKERCLDATASRTLTRRAYPAPGLCGKYYDYDFTPLAEVVQDTCNRHDAFGLACSAKYYEDMGYPGHVNCSGNFNAALQPYGIEPRRGWMAMNFFFNTNIGNCGGFLSDEPWSRPGDYILLRALTDLVCVSSACPDDIDPANGWNPTDVHVRVYNKSMEAKRSVFFRRRPESEAQMTKETGFHSRIATLTREFVEYNGYWMAAGFSAYGTVDEYWACREKAALMDLSPLRKCEILGEDAEALLQYCLPRDIRRLAVGQVSYTAMCYEDGGMIDDGTVFRLGETNFRWIGGCDESAEWLRRQATELGLSAQVKTSSEQLNNLSLQGPLSRDILKQIVWTLPTQPTLEELKWFRFTIGRLGGEDGEAVLVSRTGYTGELGYEIFCHPKDAPLVWDKIMKAGEPFGAIPMGLNALDILRIEAGLIFAGYEFDSQTSPFEAGIGFSVSPKKEEDYIGRAALIQRRDNPQRCLVGLELTGEEVATHGDGVYIGRQQAGIITSAALSPSLRKNLALCRLSAEYSELGTEVEVGKLDGHQKRIPAKVVRFPFYDPEKKKPRS